MAGMGQRSAARAKVLMFKALLGHTGVGEHSAAGVSIVPCDDPDFDNSLVYSLYSRRG